MMRHCLVLNREEIRKIDEVLEEAKKRLKAALSVAPTRRKKVVARSNAYFTAQDLDVVDAPSSSTGTFSFTSLC